MISLVKTFVVEKADRLDRLLAHLYPTYSRTHFQSLIQSGHVTCNGKQIKKRLVPNSGDSIEIVFAPLSCSNLSPEKIDLDILYEDETMLCINKPAGMVVHPAPGHHTGTFVQALLHHCPSIPVEDLRPGIVHRLDKETSGVLLAAKTREAHQRLIEAFKARAIDKEYLAITVGTPRAGRVDLPIGRDPFKRKEMAITEKGRNALTVFEIIKRFKEFALVQARPITGRTHQIRVHLKYLNTPVLGDSLYGFDKWNQKTQTKRHLLHAHRLKFLHPCHGKKMEIIAPLPEDFELFLKTMD